MTIEGIRRASNDFTTDFFKLFDSVAKSDDFSGADESEILGVEEKYDIFAFVIGEFDL